MSDKHNVPSSPAPLSSHRLMPTTSFYRVSPTQIWSSSFPAASCFSQNSCLFQTTLPSHAVPEVGPLPFCHFLSPAGISGFICSGTQMFVFLLVRVSIELSPNFVFQMNQLFSCQPPSLSTSMPYVVIENTKVRMILALVSDDRSW